MAARETDPKRCVLLIHGPNIHSRWDRIAMVIRLAFPVWQYDACVGNLLIGDLAQQVVNAIEPGFLLVNAFDYPPWRLWNVGALKYLFLSFRVHSQRRRDSRSIGLSFHCLSGS